MNSIIVGLADMDDREKNQRRKPWETIEQL